MVSVIFHKIIIDIYGRLRTWNLSPSIMHKFDVGKGFFCISMNIGCHFLLNQKTCVGGGVIILSNCCKSFLSHVVLPQEVGIAKIIVKGWQNRKVISLFNFTSTILSYSMQI